MKYILSLLLLLSISSVKAQGYEYYIMNSEVDEFDVLGSDEYESNLIVEQNITKQVEVIVGSETKAEATDGNNFDAKNTIDGNMKTAWMTTIDAKNSLIEFVIDLEELDISSATLFQIAIFNGWRKDYQTWKDFSRIKKVSLTINDKPYAEITLEDTYKMQYIDLEKMKLDKTRRYRFRFRIIETYPGKKSQQAALSDVQFIGKAK